MTAFVFRLLALATCLSFLLQGAPHLHAAEALAPKPATEDTHDEADEEHSVWTCSMHPQIQLPQPGQCPICFMDLIKVVLDGSTKLSGLRQISFTENARKLAQVEVTPVTRGEAATNIRMVGKVDYDETLVSAITAWINGRIDKLHVDYTGAKVRTGQPMAEIYSPELLTAQAELIEAVAASRKIDKTTGSLLQETVSRTEQAARKKLQLLGLSSDQISKVVAKGKPSDHVTLTAPISGIVIHKEVTEGMYVKTGMPIYTIADLSRLWVILEAYESDLHGIRMGQQVAFSAEALPGQTFSGEVSYIDPLVNEKTRTVKVRLNVDNEDKRLKPGMFVRAVAKGESSGEQLKLPLLVPASAPLITGKRAVVYVQFPDKDGLYEGREIVLGPRRGDYYEVESGLAEGDLVVSRGNFKIDSAVQIQARPSMMNPYSPSEPDNDHVLPPLFLSKLNLLNKAFIRLSTAIHADDPAAKGTLLDAFAEQLSSIQVDTLDAEDQLSWKELAMLLASDVVLLREADNTEELRRIYAETASHFHQVRTRFHVTETVLEGKVSEELRGSLTMLLEAYLLLQKDLAADAEAMALADIKPIVETAGKFASALGQTDGGTAKQLRADLEAALGQLMNSSTITDLRAAFHPLSQVVVRAVSSYGVSGRSSVYQHYCPMAFDNAGGVWLDTSEEISNPYFGSLMLRCGEVQLQLKQGE